MTRPDRSWSGRLIVVLNLLETAPWGAVLVVACARNNLLWSDHSCTGPVAPKLQGQEGTVAGVAAAKVARPLVRQRMRSRPKSNRHPSARQADALPLSYGTTAQLPRVIPEENTGRPGRATGEGPHPPPRPSLESRAVAPPTYPLTGERDRPPGRPGPACSPGGQKTAPGPSFLRAHIGKKDSRTLFPP